MQLIKMKGNSYSKQMTCINITKGTKQKKLRRQLEKT